MTRITTLALLLIVNSFFSSSYGEEVPQTVPPSETDFFEVDEFKDENFEDFTEELAPAPEDITNKIQPEAAKTPPPEIVELQEEPTPKTEELYDKDLYKKKRYIRHPNAKKGLIKIDRDKVYYYKTEKTLKDRSSSLRFGIFEPTELKNKEGLPFSEIYGDASSVIVYYDYEFHLWRTKFGRFGWKLGTGIYTAQGTGLFESETNAGITPLEGFTFIVFPNSVSGVYWMQFYDQQRIVPYLEAGGDIYTFAERRDDDKNPDLGARFGAAFAGHLAGGIAIRMGNRNSLIEMDREYGINGIYFVGEYRVTLGFSDPFDFTQNSANAGFLAEF